MLKIFGNWFKGIKGVQLCACSHFSGYTTNLFTCRLTSLAPFARAQFLVLVLFLLFKFYLSLVHSEFWHLCPVCLFLFWFPTIFCCLLTLYYTMELLQSPWLYACLGFVTVLVFQGRSQPHSPGWARVPLFSLKFGSSFLTFPQTFLIFFLILGIRWASRPPGKAMATPLWSFLFPTSSWFTLPVS